MRREMVSVATTTLGVQEREVISFEHLFEQYVRYAGRTLRYLGVPEADLEDACQEVFVVVHRRIRDLERESEARSWVRAICVRVAQNARRTVRRRKESALESSPEPIGAATQEEDVERVRMREKLLALLDRLTEEQRTVFVLYEIESLSMQEIASIVQCPLQTAYSRLHSARAKMKEGLS